MQSNPNMKCDLGGDDWEDIDNMVIFDICSTRIFYEQAANAIHLNWKEVSKKPEEEKVMIRHSFQAS